jgi:hypothetical protein
MTLTAYNHVPLPSFMYGTAWKKEATTRLAQLAAVSGFTALVGEALAAPKERDGWRRSNR